MYRYELISYICVENYKETNQIYFNLIFNYFSYNLLSKYVLLLLLYSMIVIRSLMIFNHMKFYYLTHVTLLLEMIIHNSMCIK